MNKPWVKEEIKKELKDFLKFNGNEGTIYQNLWDTMKSVLRSKFIALNAYIKKVEKSHTIYLTAYLRSLEQKEEASPRMSRRQEIIKLKAQ